MLETLADFDDELMEMLLEEQEPPAEDIVRHLQKTLGADQIVPVLMGVAERDMGVRRLLEALLKETPDPGVTAARVTPRGAERCDLRLGAALAARITTVVFGAPDPKAGACGSLYNLGADPRLNHDMKIVPGIREAEAATLMRQFFAERRSG